MRHVCQICTRRYWRYDNWVRCLRAHSSTWLEVQEALKMEDAQATFRCEYNQAEGMYQVIDPAGNVRSEGETRGEALAWIAGWQDAVAEM